MVIVLELIQKKVNILIARLGIRKYWFIKNTILIHHFIVYLNIYQLILIKIYQPFILIRPKEVH